MSDEQDTLDVESLGEPVRIRELSFSLVTQDPEGHHIAWAAFLETVLNSTALVGVRTDTGEVLHHDLSEYGEGKITITEGADGNVYVYAGDPGHFFRYDIKQRLLEDLGWSYEPDLLVVHNIFSDCNIDAFQDRHALTLADPQPNAIEA